MNLFHFMSIALNILFLGQDPIQNHRVHLAVMFLEVPLISDSFSFSFMTNTFEKYSYFV